MGLLVQQTTLEGFRKLLNSVWIVAYSPKIYEDNDTDQCRVCRDEILTMMKTDLKNWNSNLSKSAVDPFANLSTLNGEDENLPKDGKAEKPIVKFVRDIHMNALKNVTVKGTDNVYTCKSFGDKLQKLSRRFVLWTHIVPKLSRSQMTHQVNEIGRASSARSEAYLKDLKRRILQGQKTLRLDKVIIQHFIALNGTVNLLAPNKHARVSPTSF